MVARLQDVWNLRIQQSVENMLDQHSPLPCHSVSGPTRYNANKETVLNEQWSIKKTPAVTLNYQKLINQMSSNDQRKFALIYPTRFWPRQQIKYYPLSQGVKKIDGNHAVHCEIIGKYLDDLYSAGVIYELLPHHKHSTLLLHPDIPLLPWEPSHRIHAGPAPARVTGKCFLVNKNQYDTERCRLVVNFSQFSYDRSKKLKFPKVPQPTQGGLADSMRHVKHLAGIDLSSGFYHIPVSIGSSLILTISDGTRIFAFRKVPMGLGLSPWAMCMLSSIIKNIIQKEFPTTTAISYMDDIMLLNNVSDKIPVENIIQHLKQYGIIAEADKATTEDQLSTTFMGIQWERDCYSVKQELSSKVIDYNSVGAPHYQLNGLLTAVATNIPGRYTALANAYSHDKNHLRKVDEQELKSSLSSKMHYQPMVTNHTNDRQLVFVDASDNYGGYHIQNNNDSIIGTITFPPQFQQKPIHVKETIIATAVAMNVRKPTIITDSTYVMNKKYTRMPAGLGPMAYQYLHHVPIIYVQSAFNPADIPSRPLTATIHDAKLAQKHAHRLHHAIKTNTPLLSLRYTKTRQIKTIKFCKRLLNKFQDIEEKVILEYDYTDDKVKNATPKADNSKLDAIDLSFRHPRIWAQKPDPHDKHTTQHLTNVPHTYSRFCDLNQFITISDSQNYVIISKNNSRSSSLSSEFNFDMCSEFASTNNDSREHIQTSDNAPRFDSKISDESSLINELSDAANS